jgi:hypothetical protein
METLNISEYLLLIIVHLFGIVVNILYYIGHKRKWGIFFDHKTKEWIFARKYPFLYRNPSDHEKRIYIISIFGIILLSTTLIIIIIVMVLRIYR